MTWAVEAPVESSGQRLVLIMLANHCNSHTGQCNPSHKLLAQECCMGVSTLKNHIKRLEDLRLLEIIHKAIDGVSLPNQYTLNLTQVGKNLDRGGSEIEGRVGQNLMDGGSKSDRGVGQNLATNQELKPRSEPGIKPEGVSPEIWDSFVKQRKAKKAQITDNVIAAIDREARKAGWTLESALNEIVVRNWQSFKAEWVADKTETVYQKSMRLRVQEVAPDIARQQTYEDHAQFFRTIDITPEVQIIEEQK